MPRDPELAARERKAVSAPAQIAWVRDADAARTAAAFFAAQLATQPDYISHGEVLAGRSEDGRTFAPDLDQVVAAEFAAAAQEAEPMIAAARAPDGAIVGIAVVAWAKGLRMRYAVLEDLVVAAAARGEGRGAAMLAFIEREARSRGARWLLLESGRENAGAHRFFERHGFRQTSCIFMKPLG